jgi:protein-L-isoaspartate O-methyltransferase
MRIKLCRRGPLRACGCSTMVQGSSELLRRSIIQTAKLLSRLCFSRLSPRYNASAMVAPTRVDLYNNAYGTYGKEVYRQVRLETYGQDLGQTSWVTSDESNQIPQLLGLTPDSYVLEVGCGAGGYALKVAETIGCRILGVDINNTGIDTANKLAASRNLERVRFEHCDVSQKMPFADAT